MADTSHFRVAGSIPGGVNPFIQSNQWSKPLDSVCLLLSERKSARINFSLCNETEIPVEINTEGCGGGGGAGFDPSAKNNPTVAFACPESNHQ